MSLILLVLLSLFFILISLIIWTSSGKPVFFLQERIGQNFKKFMLIKFRTMSVVKNHHTQFDLNNKSRVTPIGKILRKYKIDELPQLFNVLKGDMGLVGPRPEVEEWVNCYTEQWAEILTVKPGITDIASITYSNEEQLLAQSNDPHTFYKNEILPRKLELYRQNISKMKKSIFYDYKIMLLTLKKILSH